LVERLREKPFWIWDQKQHKQEDIKTKGDCCFNHVIGLPMKDKIEKTLFVFEKLLCDSLLISDFYNPMQHTQTNVMEEKLWKHCIKYNQYRRKQQRK
jgi:hypothetical protein